MPYLVTGIGIDNAELRYEKEALEDVRYLGSKMRDNGCRSVKVIEFQRSVIGRTNSLPNADDPVGH